MSNHEITDAEYAAASQAGRQASESQFRAYGVSYNRILDAVEIITVKNGGFVIPRRIVGALQDVSPEDLAGLDTWPDGSVIEIEKLDIHISVDGMIKSALPILIPGRIVAGLFAARGGAAKSSAKASSSRANGKMGGRPKKKVEAA